MKRAVVILLFVIVSGAASAQYYEQMIFVGWNVNTPLVNKEFASKTSSRGARIGYRKLIREQVAIGFDLIYATYDGYTPRQTYYSTNNAITTDYVNYANNYGALFTGDYYFFKEKSVMPYVGLGAGLAYNSYKKYFNVYASGDNSFGFMARPQAGVWIKAGERKNWGINAGVHYDFSTARSKDFGYKSFMNLGFELGLVFLQW
ncbi:MAG TPA: hypothetical protein VF473_04005 [Cyclobacteriaceae bacterium]